MTTAPTGRPTKGTTLQREGVADLVARLYSNFHRLDAGWRQSLEASFFTQRQVVRRRGVALQQTVEAHLHPVTFAIPSPFPNGIECPSDLLAESPRDDGAITVVAVGTDYPPAWYLTMLLHVAFNAELGSHVNPLTNMREEIAIKARGATTLFAVHRGRVVGMLEINTMTPAATMICTTDGRALIPSRCMIRPETPGTRTPVIGWVWIAPSRRRAGLGTILLRAACDRIGVEPADALYGLPFSPGGVALVSRVVGRRFLAASENFYQGCMRLGRDEFRFPPPHRVDEIDDAPEEVLRAIDRRLSKMSSAAPPPAEPLAPGMNRHRRRAALKREARQRRAKVS